MALIGSLNMGGKKHGKFRLAPRFKSNVKPLTAYPSLLPLSSSFPSLSHFSVRCPSLGISFNKVIFIPLVGCIIAGIDAWLALG